MTCYHCTRGEDEGGAAASNIQHPDHRQQDLTANASFIQKMSPIKDFTLTYELPNPDDIFSEGDTVTGTVRFILTKEIKVKKLLVKLKGDAHVHWTQGSGDHKKSYSASRRYFKVKEHLVEENATDTVLSEGPNEFKFSLQIPQDDLPSSYKDPHGKIVYMLEAKLSRSWHFATKSQTELKLASKSLAHHGRMMFPHSGSVDKDIGVFSKGQVQMSATIDRSVCSPGDTLSIVAKISNCSSKKMKPKFSLQQKIEYNAGNGKKVCDSSLCKIVGETIQVNAEETVTCPMEIPANVVGTIHNCEILSLEYYLKVYLDISFAVDPEVVFPLVIIPSVMRSYQTGADAASCYGAFPHPPLPDGLHPSDPFAYGYPEPEPTEAANTSGFNNQ
ncbi:Arrestin domain-containing protein 3 [Collichthys lucidus]|uniref:Arrestin domain-containing protein 3 n=1 Tax=Collichthys lucidus TaxID=240159 RepID=A0A4U5UUG2_COLLU|nr:Arrestin domain-containing protein 3 [Collichthys lucidus]